MAKVLVTGASGFIGRALTKALVRQSDEVIGLGSRDGDIADSDTLKPYAGVDFDRVFHLAAKTFVPDSWKNPLAFYHTNVLGTANVLEFCKARGVPLTFVSAYIYGQPEELPIREDSPIRPNNPYGLSKYLAEQLCGFYAQAYALPIIVIRPFNIYGIGQNERFLIPSVIKQALYEPLINVQDLRPKRDYLYIDDLLDAMICTLNITSGFCIYNVASGKSIDVGQLIEVVQSVAKTQKDVRCQNLSRPDEINDVFADISKASRELDWHPKTSFRNGLHRMISQEIG